ncbi:hypothetical protein XocBAI15_14705 [Xanthomonas oryzae pv. oryzicola]|nr:hypothetical protein XocBAI15_14705 [Xanthomonas oryzae pv. oryzicola]
MRPCNGCGLGVFQGRRSNARDCVTHNRCRLFRPRLLRDGAGLMVNRADAHGVQRLEHRAPTGVACPHALKT